MVQNTLLPGYAQKSTAAQLSVGRASTMKDIVLYSSYVLLSDFSRFFVQSIYVTKYFQKVVDWGYLFNAELDIDSKRQKNIQH